VSGQACAPLRLAINLREIGNTGPCDAIRPSFAVLLTVRTVDAQARCSKRARG
jgi:hypothetical protein